MKINKTIEIKDYHFQDIRRLSLFLTEGQSNLLLCYPLGKIEKLDYGNYDEFNLTLNGKKIQRDDVEKLIKDSCYISLKDNSFNDSQMMYSQLLSSFSSSSNHLEEKFIQNTKVEKDNLNEIEKEKQKEIDVIDDKYEEKIACVNAQADEDIANLRRLYKKEIDPSKYFIRKNKIEIEEVNEKRKTDISFLNEDKKKEITSVNLKFDPRIKAFKKAYQAKSIQVEHDLKDFYLREKGIVKSKLKEIDLKIQEAKGETKESLLISRELLLDDFYARTLIEKDELKSKLDAYLRKLNFEPNFLFKLKKKKAFSSFELLKLIYLNGIVTGKRIFVLDLVSNSWMLEEQKQAIEMLNIIERQNKMGLIVTNNIVNLKYSNQDAFSFIAFEGKTIEASSNALLLSNPLNPVVKKLFKQEKISEDDLALLDQQEGELSEITKQHFVLVTDIQKLAYQRLLKAKKDMTFDLDNLQEDKKKKVIKKQAQENVKSILSEIKPESEKSKEVIEKSISSVINDKKREKKINSKINEAKKNNNEINIKTYLLEKREKDNKWIISLEESKKVIKLFKTKEEATYYAREIAAKQGAKVKIRISKGKNAGQFVDL